MKKVIQYPPDRFKGKVTIMFKHKRPVETRKTKILTLVSWISDMLVAFFAISMVFTSAKDLSETGLSYRNKQKTYKQISYVWALVVGSISCLIVVGILILRTASLGLKILSYIPGVLGYKIERLR